MIWSCTNKLSVRPLGFLTGLSDSISGVSSSSSSAGPGLVDMNLNGVGVAEDANSLGEEDYSLHWIFDAYQRVRQKELHWKKHSWWEILVSCWA